MTILIDNFSLEISEYSAIEDLDYFAVDVIDYENTISTSGTYFLLNDEVVDTSLSGIIGGYRAYYYTNYLTSSGTITLTIHAENNIGDIEDVDFTFLSGYRVEFNDYIDWGPRNTVITTVKASNLAFCPNTEGASTYFETAELQSIDLNASIMCAESVNLGAQIYPQNTFYFYGRTYMVTISGVKDFSGNIMEPVTFSFTIENPND